MSTAEQALSPSPGGKLSKLRIGRKKNDNDSSASLPSTSPERDGFGRRTSVEGMIDKLRPSNRRSTDDRRNSTDASRLSKLSSKLKRRKSDDGRQNSTISTGSGDGNDRLSRQPSDQSLGLLASSRSSLLTEDSAESPGYVLFHYYSICASSDRIPWNLHLPIIPLIYFAICCGRMMDQMRLGAV